MYFTVFICTLKLVNVNLFAHKTSKIINRFVVIFYDYHKTFLFSIGIAAILTVSIMSSSIQTNMAFPQNSNQNMMMGHSL